MPLQLFTYGKGDDTASWAVTDYSIVSYVSGQGQYELTPLRSELRWARAVAACQLHALRRAGHMQHRRSPACPPPCPPAHACPVQAVNMSDWFNQYSDLASDPDDPMPLAPVNTDWNAGDVDEFGRPVNVYSGITDQLVAVVITIERFWKASLINSVLPVVLVFCLGMFLFCCGE